MPPLHLTLIATLATATLPAGVMHAASGQLQLAAMGVAEIVAHRGASAERPESTLAAVERAIEAAATAVEMDVRMSRDGGLFVLHDPTLNRTTDGLGLASALTLAELMNLDAGSWFHARYRDERVPTLAQVATTARGRIGLLLDLKEQGAAYDESVAALIRARGHPSGTIVGVRSVTQAERFRRLLPEARQLGFIPKVTDIDSFAAAGVDAIRIWPRWLEANDAPARQVHASGAALLLNATLGDREEAAALLAFEPDWLLTDHPAQLKRSLAELRGER
jgi:glycerophosphoryl diester phosphodiesterase